MEVRVDPRTELLAIIFRLAGAEEFRSDTESPYALAVDRWFTPYRDHPAVRAVRQLREQRGISNDAVMSFAVQLGDVPVLIPRVAFRQSQLETRWTTQDAEAFAPLVEDFARASHAERFFNGQQSRFRTAVDRMTRMLDTALDQAWFPRFFGDSSSRARFIVSIAFLNGGFAYATRYSAPNGPREYYAIMNVSELDSAGVPLFDPSLVSTLVHEFCHSFVNPVTDAHLDELRPQADTVLSAVAQRMRQQGYREARTVISESLVRAAVARYILAHQGADSAHDELDQQKIISGFIWLDDIYALFGTYERARNRFHDFESFFPLIAAYYADLAPRMSAELRHFEHDLAPRRPRVVAVTPTNGSTDVDPALTTLSFRFDRPMRSSYATMLVGPQGREHFPRTIQSAWDTTHTVFTMTVKLRPNSPYEFSLNLGGTFGFVSQDGVPLASYLMRFSTGSSR